MNEKIYKGLQAIGERLEISKKLARKMICRKTDPLPAKRIGREYWITERKLVDWLDS
ncbi:MAG TPA: hypothetical protein P5160_09175 [Candidatus Omnitrophota bacterium]|nr:hypothetical protein [Candidatus Omnitrophota bacterium]